MIHKIRATVRNATSPPMNIVEITTKTRERYNRFVESHPLGTIHQTWEWGEFQEKSSERDKSWIIALENGQNEIIASALVLRQKMPFGKCWLYSPRGPLVDFTKPEESKKIFGKISEIAKKEGAVFLRFDPPLQNDKKSETTQSNEQFNAAHLFYRDIKAKNAHAHYQPEATVMVDLAPSEEEILKQMKPKGRYNIKVAQKHGVTVRASAEPKNDVKIFYDLFSQTTSRDGFSGHPLSYYQSMFTELGTKQAKLYLAEYEGKPLAAAIVTYFQKTATYYFGASGNEYRNVMAPYLLHWQIMGDAKRDGYKEYDFFGIAPEGAKNHPWASVTDFKLKFGGKIINYYPAREIIYRPFWYHAVRLAKLLKKLLR